MTLIVVLIVLGALLLLFTAGALGAGRLVAALVGARPPVPAEAERVEVYVEALCLGAGLPVPQLVVIDDEACGALAYGRGPRSATIAVTSGLLTQMAPTELEGTLAHLLARIANGTARRDTNLCALALLGGPVGAVWASRRLDAARVVAVDVSAAKLTRFPPGLMGALARMGESAAGLRRRSPAIRHLWMHEALGPGSLRVRLEDRITFLSDL